MLVKKDQKIIDDAGRHAGAKKISKASSANMESDNDKKTFLDITALIRSVQRAEGHTDCFREGLKDCDEVDCNWRSFCLEGHQDLNKDKT